jgi:hypothetical protein
LHEIGRLFVGGGEFVQRFVERKQVLARLGKLDLIRGLLDALVFAPRLEAALAAGIFDEYAAHRFSSRGEEVAPAVPLRLVPLADQPQVGFVYERRRLQRLPCPFMRQSLCRQPTQFRVNERQQLARGMRVPLIDRIQ